MDSPALISPMVLRNGELQAANSRPAGQPGNVREAAEQFEALLIGQLLKESAAHQTTGLSGEPDAASESMLEIGYEQVSRALAAGGGFGLARMISAQLGPQSITPANHRR
jgi:Rod binding domain-containing protein